MFIHRVGSSLIGSSFECERALMKMTKELEGIPAAHENPRFCRLRATVLNGLLNALFSKRRSFPLHSFFSDYATLKMLLNGRGDSFLCEQLSQFLILFFFLSGCDMADSVE